MSIFLFFMHYLFSVTYREKLYYYNIKQRLNKDFNEIKMFNYIIQTLIFK